MRALPKICVLAIAIGTCFASVCAAKKKKQPVFVESGFQFAEVDTIYILPAVDLMVNKDKDPERRLEQVDCMAVGTLKKRGYRTVPERAKCKEPTPATRMRVAEDELKEPQESWIRTLGPDDARWVLVLALEDASSKMTFGSTGNAIVMGTLYDKKNGKLVWRAVGTGQSGQGGLLGMAFKGMMSDMAIDEAVMDLTEMIEKQKRK